ncbi:MAG: hypothetical protein R3B45_09415 [Bdellovibrionota bacterium]
MMRRLFINRAFILGLILGSSLGYAGGMKSQLSIDVPGGNVMTAGNASNFQFEILKESGERHIGFMKMHAKPMHLLIVKSDLSSFAHVHPYLNEETGIFTLPINAASDDPDNFDAQRAVSSSGRYFYFNEMMPTPINEQMPMLMGRGEFYAEADEATAKASDQPSLADDEHVSVKYYKENGELGSEGDFYKVVFSYEQFRFCSIWMPKFYAKIYMLDENGSYVQGDGFDRWLGMGGHSIVISKFGTLLKDKVFYHMHSFLPMAEKGKFVFPYDNHKESLPDGEYKTWIQVNHNQHVYTFSFTFDYTNPPIDDAVNKCVGR